ncbi:MAG: PAS domain-containing protein [Anaerolineae bacterium]|nr:PAS domain-containing protein [Anaerolineae bacterium]
MNSAPVFVLDRDVSAGQWVLKQLYHIGITVRLVSTVSDLLADADTQRPVICLIALRPPVWQVLSLITDFTQEPRFAHTTFILMGSLQHKRAAFEAGVDDYLVTPLDVIELRKRVRLYLDRHELESRVVAETRITQEIERGGPPPRSADTQHIIDDLKDETSVSLLEHAAVLTQERNRFQLILHHAGIAVSLVSPDGIVLYVNPAWEDLIGQLAAQAVGQPITWPPVTADVTANQALADAIASGSAWRGDVHYELPNGRQLDVAMSISPGFDASNTLVGFVVAQQDIAVRRAGDNLKMQFLADAAQELRTPVTNIKMRQYLLRQASADQQPMHMQALERETERLSHLIEAMLELSHIDAGLMNLECEEQDINQLVADMAVRYGPLAEEKGVTLAMTRHDSLPMVMADGPSITRAISLVIDNAVQYTTEGGHIDIRLGYETWSGGEYVTVQVKDTGMGIDKPAMDNLFKRFFRSERARDSGIRGVGLGLAIAYEIITRHNGDISVESTVGVGSTFTIWLPVTPPCC